MKEMFISVILYLNEFESSLEKYIKSIVFELKEICSHYEILIVDDTGEYIALSDDVELLLKEYEGIRFIKLSRHFGKEIAIIAGLDNVIGDYVLVMIPNVDQPTIIKQVIPLAEKGVDVIYGVRKNRASQSWYTRLSAKCFYWYCDKFLHLKIPENSTDFRCLSRRAVNAITSIKDSSKYLRLIGSFIGYQTQPFIYQPNTEKSSIRKFMDSISQAINIILETSTHPLRIITWLSIFVSISNLLYIVYVFIINILKHDVANGWTTLSLQSSFQFLCISLILMLLSEYIGRMFKRFQNRPLYYIMDEKNSDTLIIEPNRINVLKTQ